MLQLDKLDRSLFVQMMQSGHAELSAHKEEINALNVFPVPDGDTGTNMTLSYAAGLEQLDRLPVEATLEQVTAALSAGFLMGARGNSGVILSQLFRGFQLAFGQLSEIDGKALAKAFALGVQTAYKAVSRPVEGTILTVAREASHAAEQEARKSGSTLATVVEVACARAEQALARTPEQLPILRQAGVVDSGGQGYLYILRGFYKTLIGHAAIPSLTSKPVTIESRMVSAAFAEIHGQGEYGYCTEMIIRAGPSDQSMLETKVRSEMARLGDSLLVVTVSDPASSGVLVKVHVHTEHPGSALEVGLSFGSLLNIKIDNMTEQYDALTATSVRQQDNDSYKQIIAQGEALDTRTQLCGLVVVSAGDGFATIFRELQADVVISCQEGMNPSTEEIMQAVAKIDAEHVFVLPNHPNVIMAAEQAASLAEGRLIVIPTRSLGAGLGAALAFASHRTVSENEEGMRRAAASIHSGAVTVAVRDAQIGDHAVSAGDYVGVIEGNLCVSRSTRQEALEAVMRTLCAEQVEICTLFYAQQSDLAEAADVLNSLQAEFPAIQFETQFGGQPVYDFLLAAE